MIQPGSPVSWLPRWAVIRDARLRQRRRRRRRGAVVMVALAVAGAVWLTGRLGAVSRGPSAARAERQAQVAVGGYIGQAQVARDRIWVLTCVYLCGAADTGLDSERLVEVDTSSGRVLRRLRMADVSAFTQAGGSLWVAHFLSGEVARITPATGRVTLHVGLRLPVALAPGVRQFMPTSLSASRGYVWASTARGWIAQIRERNARLVRTVRTPSEDNGTTTNRYGTWVAENLDGVGLMAPHGTRLTVRAMMQAGLPLDVGSVLSSGATVWAVATTDQWGTRTRTVVLVIDPRTGRVARRVQLPDVRGAVTAGGALYLGDLAHARIYRVSADGTLTSFQTARRHAWLAAASASALWAATDTRPGRLLRIMLPRG